MAILGIIGSAAKFVWVKFWNSSPETKLRLAGVFANHFVPFLREFYRHTRKPHGPAAV